MAAELKTSAPYLKKFNKIRGLMEVLNYILIVSLVLVMFGLLGFIVWNNIEHRKTMDDLTSKLVARSLGEYVAATQKKVNIPEPKKEKKYIDSTMGAAGKNF